MRRSCFAMGVAVALLAISAAARAQNPPLKPPDSPAFPGMGIPAEYTHEWHWGELLYGKTYPTTLTIENGCDRTEDVTITRVDLRYLSLPDRVAVPPGKLDVDGTITTPPPPVIGPQPFPPPHGIWTQVNGLVDVRHAFTAPPKCFENKKVYWTTGHIHYDPNPPPPPIDTPSCAAYYKLNRKPPAALNCEGEMRDLALADLDDALAGECPEPWNWLPTEAEIGSMSEDELIAFKRRADGQIGIAPRPPPPAVPEGPCGAYWNGGAMPALNCTDQFREFALEYRRILSPLAEAGGAWSWLPTEAEIGSMSEDELIAFKRRAAGPPGFEPTPAASESLCAAYWNGGPPPAMNCANEMRELALEYRRRIASQACPDPSSLPTAEEIATMSEDELLAFRQQISGQAGLAATAPPPLVGPCAEYWKGGAMPALNCADELREFALDYLRRILGPLAAAYPDTWSWLPTEAEIGSMSEGDLIAFRQRAVRQLGT